MKVRNEKKLQNRECESVHDEKETHVRRYSGGPLILALIFHPKRAFPFYV